MNKINEKDTKHYGDEFDPVVEHFLRELRHPSSYSKEMLSKIAIKAMVIISKESRKAIVNTLLREDKS